MRYREFASLPPWANRVKLLLEANLQLVVDDWSILDGGDTVVFVILARDNDVLEDVVDVMEDRVDDANFEGMEIIGFGEAIIMVTRS
jgi:NhaP-type Na+/H+ and K+/H+ antiporter